MQNEKHYLKAHPTLLSGSFDCSQCFYGLQFDTYQNGCTHDCQYCWAKTELSKTDQWNNPKPIPIDIVHLKELFHTVFETDKSVPLRHILEQRIPLRLGSMSDPFLAIEKKLNITYETLKILSYYKYPTLILTRSDLVADEKYIQVMDKERTAIQLSIPSTNEKLSKILEPGAPSPILRLLALEKLMKAGIWTTVRLNPLFPTHPDGFYSKKQIVISKTTTTFDLFQLEMIDQIAQYGCKGILTGFAHLNEKTLSYIHREVGINLRDFMTEEFKLRTSGFKYTDNEIRSYYQVISDRCKLNQMEFSTCYLGLGESFFWKDQDLWADKLDCCNIKNHVKEFKTDTNQIPIQTRMKLLKPNLNYFTVTFYSFYYKLSSFLIKSLWKK